MEEETLVDARRSEAGQQSRRWAVFVPHSHVSPSDMEVVVVGGAGGLIPAPSSSILILRPPSHLSLRFGGCSDSVRLQLCWRSPGGPWLTLCRGPGAGVCAPASADLPASSEPLVYAGLFPVALWSTCLSPSPNSSQSNQQTLFCLQGRKRLTTNTEITVLLRLQTLTMLKNRRFFLIF